MEENNEVSDIVTQLVEQLKNTASIIDKRQKENKKERLTTNDIEDIIIDNSTKLIKGSVGVVDDLKELLLAAPNAEDIEALSKLVAASAAAIESLNKIYITNRRTESVREIKQMDIDSKHQIQQTEIKGKLLMNREELMKQLINDAKIIEAETTTISH